MNSADAVRAVQAHSRLLRAPILLALFAALSACGGGGGGTTVADASTPTPAPAPAPTPAPAPAPTPAPAPAPTLTLTGVVARGAAIAGGAVSVTCQTGTGTATTGTNGSYTISITNGALPCVAKVVGTDGAVLYSVAQGTGSTATANITPLTELVVAQAVGAPAATLYTTFDAAAQAKVSASALATATSVVASALQSVVSLAGVDPFKDTLVAGSGTGLDGKLDTLGATLTSAQLTLAQLSAAIVANGAAAAPVVATVTQPAAASCPSFRTGSFAVLYPGETVPADRFKIITANAATLVLTQNGATINTLIPVAGKACQYTDGFGSTTVASPSGVAVSSGDTLGVGIPLQTIPLADLAGVWNLQGFDTSNGASGNYGNYGGLVTLDTAGKLSNFQTCSRLLPCVADNIANGPTLRVEAAGGYSFLDNDGANVRLFAFRATSGDLSIFAVDDKSKGITFLTRQKALTLPAVGEATPIWDLSVNSAGVSSGFSQWTSTITAVNTAAGTYSRSRSSDGRIDTFAVNNPRSGLRYRALNSCTNASGAAVSCSGNISMPLPGTGVTVHGSAVAGTDFLGVSVNQPAGATTTGASSNAAGVGTLVASNGTTYSLRVTLNLGSTGLVTSGSNYDFHTLVNTTTPCTVSTANQSTCFGANNTFGQATQSGALTSSGASTSTTLRTAADSFGYAFNGTVNGAVWSGTVTKTPTANSPNSDSGTFSVTLSGN
jgi:hypothetical protein